VRHRAGQRASFTGGMLAIAALLGLGVAPGRAQVEGKPRIVDGQTLEVAGRRFHLQGVQAPALDQVCHRVGRPYPCGKVARAVLWDLTGGLDVICTPLPDAGAAAAAVPATCSAGAADLNQGMVASGWALADGAAGDAYAALEDAARAAGRGLWSGEFELPGRPAPVAE